MVGDVLVVHPLTARRSAGASVAPAESLVPGLAVMEIIQRDWCMQRYDCGRERRGMARRNGGGVLETNALSGKLVIMAGATIMEDYLIRSALQYSGRYWGHSGHRAALGPDCCNANDP